MFARIYRELKVVSVFGKGLKPLPIANFVHTSVIKNDKIFAAVENDYAYKILRKFTPVLHLNKNVETLEEFNSLLEKNYRLSTATEIVETFQAVQSFASKNNIPVSDERYDNLVNGLMDHCEHLSSEELLQLIRCLAKYPLTESYMSHNFHDIWSCLDDMSLRLVTSASFDCLLQLADAWYRLNLARVCDFVHQAIDQISKRARRLSKDQILQIFFLINVRRSFQMPYEYEDVVEKHLSEFNVDELAIIALGYFKSQNKVKPITVQRKMIAEVTSHSQDINEISLAAILKVIRFTKPIYVNMELTEMLDKLTHEIDRLSIKCCLHIILLGSHMLKLHEPTLEKTVEKIMLKLEDVDEVRLKDIERMLLAVTTFDYTPKCVPDFYERVYKEVHKDSRRGEMVQYPRLIASILNYFSIRGVYSYDLLNQVMDEDFIAMVYGKAVKSIPRDIFSLNCCIEVDCPDYKGNRLSLLKKYKSAKWLTEFIPGLNQYTKITAHDKLFLDVQKRLTQILGDRKFIHLDHILPHFPKADFIICKDLLTNKYIEPPGFENYILGDVKYPFQNGFLRWTVISVVGWNNTIRDTSFPVGITLMKKRQLERIGYVNKLVIWNEYMLLPVDEKIQYMEELLRK